MSFWPLRTLMGVIEFFYIIALYLRGPRVLPHLTLPLYKAPVNHFEKPSYQTACIQGGDDFDSHLRRGDAA